MSTKTIRFLSFLGNVFVFLGAAWVIADLLRHQLGFPILLDRITADGAIAGAGVVAVLAAKSLKELDGRIGRIENTPPQDK